VLCVSSFHISSTRDVWQKVMVGLRANGVTAVPFDVMQRYALFRFLEDKMKSSKREMPRDWTPTTLAYEAILGAAVYHDCEWLLVVSPQYMPPEIPQMAQRIGIKTAAYFTECPYEDTIHTPVTASNFNVSLLSDKHSVGMFESFCDRVEYVPHCYDPALSFLPAKDERENVVFIGTGYQTRVKFMSQVDWPLQLDMYGWWPREWLRPGNKLKGSVRSPNATTPGETGDIYRKALMAFNLHREMRYAGSAEAIMEGEAYSLSPRTWELAACGTFQVSDYRPELIEVFGDAVPVFDTPNDLSRLLRRAATEPRWRQELVQRQTEIGRPYSCNTVMKTVADVLAA